MTDKCIINYADGVHVISQQRLKKTIENITNGEYDILFWTNELPPECPSFEDSPYAFKVFAFLYAKSLGYKKVLWVDASNVLVRNPKKIFRIMDKQGYFLFGNNISTVDKWVSDYTLKKINLKRNSAKKIVELHAHIIGLNFENQVARDFLQKWKELALDGISFRGLPKDIPLKFSYNNENACLSLDPKVKGHRHDQTLASIIAYEKKMKISSRFVFEFNNLFKNIIPLDTIFVHDQSYKINSENYRGLFDKYNNTLGIKRVLFLFLSIILTPLKLSVSCYRKIKIKT